MKSAFALLFLTLTFSVSSQTVDNARGIDARVDYTALKRIGPWDDRNYQLSREDLDWLSEDEQLLTDPVPAFYRVLFRQELPDTPRQGPVQYPRSLLNYFLLRFDGYLIDGQIYTDVRWNDARTEYEVLQQNGRTPGELVRQQIRALTTDVLVFAGAESAVSVHPFNPELVVAGLNGGGGQEMRFSSDGGATWTSSPDLTGSECCDPAMDWKSDASFVYNATLGGNQVWIYRSDDNGQTWDSLADVTPGDDRRELSGPSGQLNDKEFIHVDRHPSSPFQDNLYVTWHQGNILQVATSSDDGNTFNIVSMSTEPRGIGSDITTGSDGTVYHAWASTVNSEIRMNISTNGGASFSPSKLVAPTLTSFIFPIPSTDVREVFIYAAIDIDLTGGPFTDRIYVAWTDITGPESTNPVNNHARIQVAYSDDEGDNWTVTTPHATADANDVDRWHQWLKVDRNGAVHVVFYDTRQFPARDGVDMYHSVSTDGGNTWSDPDRLTTVSSPDSASGFEFGDYNGLDFSDASDDGIAIFSDNRAEGGPNPDMDVYVAPVAGVGVPLPDLIYADGFEGINDVIFANGFD